MRQIDQRHWSRASLLRWLLRRLVWKVLGVVVVEKGVGRVDVVVVVHQLPTLQLPP